MLSSLTRASSSPAPTTVHIYRMYKCRTRCVSDIDTLNYFHIFSSTLLSSCFIMPPPATTVFVSHRHVRAELVRVGGVEGWDRREVGVRRLERA